MGGYSENCDCVDCRKVRGEPLEDVATPIMTLTPSKIAELRTQLDRVSMLTAGMYGTIPSPLSVSDTRRLLDALEAKDAEIARIKGERGILNGMWIAAEEEVEKLRAYPDGDYRVMTKGAFEEANKRLAAAEARVDRLAKALAPVLTLPQWFWEVAELSVNSPDKVGFQTLTYAHFLAMRAALAQEPADGK